MLRLLAPSIAVAALLGAAPAHAASATAGTYDDTSYAAEATFASARDLAPVVTPDVTYEGPHTAFVNVPGARDPGAPLIAQYDDASDSTPSPAAPATPAAAQAAAPQKAAPTRLACGCTAHR